MRWTDELRLETPEQIDVGLELAGLGTRFVAQLLDWLIKLLVSGVLILAAAVTAALLGFTTFIERGGPLLAALAVGALYLLWLGYDIYYESVHNGQTPGKRHAGIRVIREGGAPLDFQAACVRNLLGLADLLPGFYVLGAVLVLLTGRRQRLGDLAAGTIVIRERVLTAPAEMEEVVRQWAAEEYQFTARHLEGCARDDRHVLCSFLARQDRMDAQGRDRLAHRLAALYLRKTSYQPPRPIQGGDEATAFLASLYRDLLEYDRRAS